MLLLRKIEEALSSGKQKKVLRNNTIIAFIKIKISTLTQILIKKTKNKQKLNSLIYDVI
jgi:hypothetical protein